LGGGKPPEQSHSTRTARELFDGAKKIETEAKRRAREEAERKRINRLEKLALEEEASWAYVERLLEQKRGSPYDEATKLLVELRDMLEYKQRRKEFAGRLKHICEKHGKSVALMDRFRRSGLMK